MCGGLSNFKSNTEELTQSLRLAKKRTWLIFSLSLLLVLGSEPSEISGLVSLIAELKEQIWPNSHFAFLLNVTETGRLHRNYRDENNRTALANNWLPTPTSQSAWSFPPALLSEPAAGPGSSPRPREWLQEKKKQTIKKNLVKLLWPNDYHWCMTCVFSIDLYSSIHTVTVVEVNALSRRGLGQGQRGFNRWQVQDWVLHKQPCDIPFRGHPRTGPQTQRHHLHADALWRLKGHQVSAAPLCGPNRSTLTQLLLANVQLSNFICVTASHHKA